MTITVHALKRAVQDAIDGNEEHFLLPEAEAMSTLLRSPRLLTLLAQSLSDRGEAGNAAAKANLAALRDIAYYSKGRFVSGPSYLAHGRMLASEVIEWAIDQLTPPELASPRQMTQDVASYGMATGSERSTFVSYPPPPWPVSADANAMREGWKDFWLGMPRTSCPFPKDRRDLLKGYHAGWDAAEAKKAGA